MKKQEHLKIAFLIRSLGYGGAERQMVALARGLHKRGHAVGVIVFYPDGPLESDLARAGVPVWSLDKKGRWDVIGFLVRLVKIIRLERPDVLHGYLIFQNILASLAAFFFPRMRAAWGVRDSNINPDCYDRMERIIYKLQSWLSRSADLIIVNSYAGMNYAAANGFPKNKMIVIPNGIDTERFRRDKQAGYSLRAEWGIERDEKLVGVVGRLDPMKDHTTFLKAAAQLAEHRENVRFVCVGSGRADYKTGLIELSRKLSLSNRVIWAEAGERMTEVYNALDCVVSSSSGEGFSNVIGEAMACGVPCVVTDVGDSAWIVGELGEVVPPKAPELLGNAIEKSLNKIDYEWQATRQRIVDRFSVSNLITKTEAALFDLTERPGAV